MGGVVLWMWCGVGGVVLYVGWSYRWDGSMRRMVQWFCGWDGVIGDVV